MRSINLFAMVGIILPLSACDLYERVRDKGVIDSSRFSVFQAYSGNKCRMVNESGSEEVTVDCQRLEEFLLADSPACKKGRFKPAKGYFPSQSNPVYLCQSYRWPAFQSQDRFRILIFADAGAGQSKTYGYAQTEVASAMTTVCTEASPGCDMAIVSGDLIYPSGVDDVFDADFQHRFEDVYSGLEDMPFFVVPGNHDYLGNIKAQIEYTYFSKNWRMLDRYFAIPDLPPWLGLIGLDTTALLGELGAEKIVGSQRELFKEEICPTDGWRIVYGHHSAFSHGKHGSDRAAAAELNTLWDICPFDIYVSGHDHIQEHIHTPRYEQVVQGAGGAKVSSVKDMLNQEEYADAEVGGFRLEQRFGLGKHGFAIADVTQEKVDLYFYTTATWKYRDGSFEKKPRFSDYSYHCQFVRGDENGCVPD